MCDLISSQSVLSLGRDDLIVVFSLFVRCRWPYWLAWRCQRISNSRSSFLRLSVPWIQTNNVICSLTSLPHGSFLKSCQMGFSPLPPFSRCPLIHNLQWRNKSKLCIGYKYIDWSLWTTVLLWIAILFSYPSLCPVSSRIIAALMLLFHIVPFKKKKKKST